jgi:hypothetical protein
MFGATALFAALTLSAGADVQTLAGKTISGDLIGVDRQTIVLRSPSGESVRIPVGDALQLTLPSTEGPPRGAHTAVELTDGSVLLCSSLAVNGGSVELTMIPDVKVSLPATAVFTILRDAHEPKVRQEWQEFLTKRGRLDMVVIRADDKLNGLEGAFGPGTGDAIEFTPTATGQKRSIRLGRAQGLIFVQKANPDAPVPLCKVIDNAGNSLVAADVVLNANGLTVTTVSGARITLPDAKPLAKLDFSKGKLAYLSDLTPTREAVTLATEDDDQYARFVRYRKDLNLDNQPLKLNGKQYAKGLSLHAGTQIVYPLAADYKEFRAILGVDDSVETESRVDVIIEGDGRELFRGQTKAKDPPRPLALDVRGVRDLRITVRATGLLDFGAQAVLADAKVSK